MTVPADGVQLVKNAAAHRYEIQLDGERVGFASYSERGDTVVLPHAETLPAFGGRGLAGRLIAFSLDDIRAQGRQVVPACPFVADFIRKNPEYQDLLAAPGRPSNGPSR
ncbi:MAG: N-acetyltransferase [Actinomycetota bacterium]|nr:N-acetyltransferase [Actinomycetota bacterium]MDQ2958661.1 N-acetyltransferase [Actinomycetota bacterium]